MTNRRDFLRTSSLIVAGGLLGSSAITASELSAKAKKGIGLQLYSLRDAMKVDVPGTLKQVAEMGFTTLETANYGEGKIYGMAPSEFKRAVKDLGMKMTSAHLGGPNYTKETATQALDWWKKAIEDHVDAGVRYMVKPSMPKVKTLDELKMWCDFTTRLENLQRLQKYCSAIITMPVSLKNWKAKSCTILC